jgi:hypothetical protein
LGEYLPIGRLFPVGGVFKLHTEESPIFGRLFQRKSYVLIFDKYVMGWATFWGIFSQTHLVTLDPPNEHYSWTEVETVALIADREIHFPPPVFYVTFI